MLTLRRARELLANAAALDNLADIAHSLGVAGDARDLDIVTRESIGVRADVARAQICRGPGSARALLLDVGSSSLKETLTDTSARLAAHAPQLLWLLVAVDADRAHVAVATFSHEHQPPRTRALLCARANVVDSDAETLCALASARGQLDVMMHYRWCEILGREALTRRFYATLERVVDSLADSVAARVGSDDARELALLYVSRLLFLSFLETQGWLNGDHGFLANGFADCMASGGRYHDRVLLPLFFGTLNTPPRARSARAQSFGRIPFLNGGLFARTPLERRAARVPFPDDTLGIAFGDLFCRHRFTPREDSSEWSESAVDPEMLGRAFESLMAAGARKTSGAFYTPQRLVQRIVREAIAHVLETPTVRREDVEAFLRTRHVAPGARASLLPRINNVKVLDPACGSGAFLVFALSELSWLAAACGDERPAGQVTRSILATAIFGVDINPMAVWLCELRLWLAMVMEQRDRSIPDIAPLPNLDRQIRVGDTLGGGAFNAQAPPARWRAAKLRLSYTRAQGQRKKALARLLDRAERSRAIETVTREIELLVHRRRELLVQARARDLFGGRNPPSADVRRALAELRSSLRELRARKRELSHGSALPFSFDVHFHEVAANGGFDLVVGNPPWVRLHRMPPQMRSRLRTEFTVFESSAWTSGAASAHAGSGFGSQVDMSALFVERSLDLLKPDGVVALLLPSKLWSSLAGGGVRSLVREQAAMLTLEDLSKAPVAFDAAVYPSLLVARKTGRCPESLASFAVHRGATALAWRDARGAIAFDESRGSPWILAPPDVRRAFDRLRSAGVALADTRIGRPLLGVKSGCNEAFVVTLAGDAGGGMARITSAARTGTIERALLRPALKGEEVQSWTCPVRAGKLIWTHGLDSAPVRRLPPGAKTWLDHYRSTLEKRSDARGSERWWSLFRVDGAAFDRPRVVWADMGKRPRAAVLPAGDTTVPLNSCYVVKCRDDREALALAAVLNSDIAAAWLSLLAEPARGGYHRYLGWTMSLLPLPRDWAAACSMLPEVARQAMAGHADPTALLEAVLCAYGVRFTDVAPLLAWNG